MKKIILLISFLLVVLLATLSLVFKTTVFSGKATGSSSVAYGNSYLFSSPLQAKADGKELIRVTVFLLDGRGLGVANQPVELEASPRVDIGTVQAVTDDSGKAVFDLSSTAPIRSVISAANNGKVLPQTVKITFY